MVLFNQKNAILCSVILLASLFLMLTQYCKKKSLAEKELPVSRSNNTGIKSFSLAGELGIIPKITSSDLPIYVDVDLNTDITSLAPQVVLMDEKASLSPKMEDLQDFTNPVFYTVRAEDGETQQSYEIRVTKVDLNTRIRSFEVLGSMSTEIIEKEEGSSLIKITVPDTLPLRNISPIIQLFSTEAAIDPPSGQAVDLTAPFLYTVSFLDRQRQYEIRLSQILMSGLVEFDTPYTEKKAERSLIDSEKPILQVHLAEEIKSFSRYSYTVYQNETELFRSPLSELPKEKMIALNLAETLKAKPFDRQFLTIVFSLHKEKEANPLLSFTQELEYNYLFSANIPIIDIVTENGEEPASDKKKIKAKYTFFDTPEQGMYSILSVNQKNIAGSVNARGQASLGFPKKSFTISLNAELALLGMPKHDKWITQANYIDASQTMNALAYQLYRDMGNYAVKTHAAHIYLNHQYRGLYTFAEKIEQGTDRVPTEKAKNGGFILKLDPRIPLPAPITIQGRLAEFEYPSAPDADQIQKVKDKITAYEESITQGTWRVHLAEMTELDYFILINVFANMDSWHNNLFYFLNQKNQLEIIPWDFDNSFGPSQNVGFDAAYISDLILITNILKDDTHKQTLKSRYHALRQNILSDAVVLGKLHAIVDLLETSGAYKHDQARWKYPAGSRFTPAEIEKRLLHRLALMDSKIQNL